ncbi:MAG: hypothetical protein HY834_05135 [Devosia nanyangense]|uniref:Uncharacterized protein n=1 Tax=Devosia nanyangense TaxID=1228055 RepID=A0A933NXK6_9HYPH|nr:hypothetical protein [Devosia nanyangense]
MKSFSASSFASDNAVALEFAAEAVRDNPQALFTNFQWFLYAGKDTVFFTAFSRTRFDKEAVKGMVEQMVALAPQLTHGFEGAVPGHPFSQHLLDAITSVEEIDSFEGYPDKWLTSTQDVFKHPELPLFRMMVANLKEGPDEHGRMSILQVRSAHCLLEGSDAALLTRSQTANHGIQSNKGNKLAWFKRFRGAVSGFLMAGLFAGIGNIVNAPERPLFFRTLALPRQRIRSLATKLGVRQRSLYFALTTFALLSEKDRRVKEKVITAAYTMLDTRRTASDDDFFRVRALQASFPFSSDFVTYARAVDAEMEANENKDLSKFQLTVLAMMGAMRKLSTIVPRLINDRVWRFQGTQTDLVLTLVPPHRSMGAMTEWMIEPIYCGAFHQSTNIVTFCPGREYMTLNFVVEERHLTHIERVEKLIADLEAA